MKLLDWTFKIVLTKWNLNQLSKSAKVSNHFVLDPLANMTFGHGFALIKNRKGSKNLALGQMTSATSS